MELFVKVVISLIRRMTTKEEQEESLKLGIFAKPNSIDLCEKVFHTPDISSNFREFVDEIYKYIDENYDGPQHMMYDITIYKDNPEKRNVGFTFSCCNILHFEREINRIVATNYL